MGRAMIIICSAALISLGIIGMSTAEMGSLLSQGNVSYAHKTSATNAAHTGIQIAMDKISQDTAWIESHNSYQNRYESTINNPVDILNIYAEYLNSDYDSNDYWKSDSVRIISEAKITAESAPVTATVTSVYLMDKFSTLVPSPTAPLQFPDGVGNIDTDGAAHEINGTDSECGESLPPVTVGDEETEQQLEDNETLITDRDSDPVETDTTLDYQPTDELIERLENSGNTTTVTGDYSETLGTAEDPGVFFVDGDVTLTGQQSEGHGIMVVRNSADMAVEDPDDPNNELTIRGNFEWNGLLIFENADAFTGSGTPDINGSVLIGDTDDNTQIDVDLSGNININYSCQGMEYARRSAANTTDENKYTRMVTYESIDE